VRLLLRLAFRRVFALQYIGSLGEKATIGCIFLLTRENAGRINAAQQKAFRK